MDSVSALRPKGKEQSFREEQRAGAREAAAVAQCFGAALVGLLPVGLAKQGHFQVRLTFDRVDWPKKSALFMTTKMVFPCLFKCRNSGSEKE